MPPAPGAEEPALDMPPLAQRSILPVELLRCFLLVGATGFGGVLPVVFHEVVHRRHWLSQAEFTEIMAICQIIPGANVINFALVFGMRAAGWRGGAACVAGLLAAPLMIVMGLALLWSGYNDLPWVQDMVRAVAAAAAGLVSAMALRRLWPLRRKWLPLLIVASVLVAMVVLRLPLLAIILVMAPISFALVGWRRG